MTYQRAVVTKAKIYNHFKSISDSGKVFINSKAFKQTQRVFNSKDGSYFIKIVIDDEYMNKDFLKKYKPLKLIFLIREYLIQEFPNEEKEIGIRVTKTWI